MPPAGRRARGRGPADRALEGQGHDPRPLGADGDRHAAGPADVPARLSTRRDRPVHAPHRPRRARQQGGERHGDHPGARGGAPGDGQVDRLHVGRLGVPGRRSRGDDPARGALRGLPERPRDPHRQARGRARDRPPVHRRSRKLRAHAEPPRLLARAEEAELPDAAARGRRHRPRRREDRRHLRRPGHRREPSDEVERGGDHEDGGAAPDARRGLRVRQPRRDGHALGPPERPDQLPPLPAGLRPAPVRSAGRAPPGGPPDRHLRPWVRPDDALHRPLARARAAARLRPGQERERPDPRRGVRRRRRDGEHLARREGARPPASRASRSSNRERPERSRTRRARVRRRARSRCADGVQTTATGPDPYGVVFEAVKEYEPRLVLEVGCGRGELAERIGRSSTPEWSPSTSPSEWSS